jgi:hypothetical protein
MTMTILFSYIMQSKIKAKKGNKLADPLRNNNEFDPDTNENIIVGSSTMVPSEVCETVTT